MKLGVCYYPEHWSKDQWHDDIKKMKQIGISTVRIFEFTWGLVESEENKYDFTLLNEVMDLLEKNNINVIMCTPTASLPPWLVVKYPEVRAYTDVNTPMVSGTRRNYSFSSEKYREFSRKITKAYAENFKDYKNIVGWQTDNEYGGLSYSPEDLLAFRKWLQAKYKSLDNLNKAWGSEFWSLIYGSFDEIEFPAPRCANPTQVLDFHRFHADNVTSFNKEQVDIINSYYKDIPVTHNFMVAFPYVNQFDLMADLDVPSIDFYPLGVYSNETNLNPSLLVEQSQFRRGFYTMQGFTFDLTRGVGNGKFWILEHQAGPINWAQHNPVPQDGMIRLWGIEGIAHGATLLSPFRWRQCLAGFEAFHSGLLLPSGDIAQGGVEYTQISQDIKKLEQAGFKQDCTSEVAFIYDYDSLWAFMSQSQSISVDKLTIFHRYYEAFINLGANVDVISSKHDLSSYKVVVLTQSMLANPTLIKNLQNFKGQIILSPRTFSREEDLHIPEELPLVGIENLIDVKILQLETFAPYVKETIIYKDQEYTSTLYREHIQTNQKVVAEFKSDEFRGGSPAVVRNNNLTYITCMPENSMLVELFSDVCKDLDIRILPHRLPQHLKMRRSGEFVFFFNYAKESLDVSKFINSKNYDVIIGEQTTEIKSAGVLAIKYK